MSWIQNEMRFEETTQMRWTYYIINIFHKNGEI